MLTQSLFHSGKLSTRAKGLMLVASQGVLSVSPLDASRLGLEDGARVHVSNGRGHMTTTVKIQDRVPAGLVLFPEHFDQDVRRLLEVVMDPVTRVPYFKLAKVTVERL
jgi:formate dehydrogenase alpha subunit